MQVVDEINIIKYMKDVYLGKDELGEDIILNFEKEGVRFTLLIGETGSGKSIFHNNLYQELSAKHTSQEIGFVFMDMTQVDFTLWNSEYLAMPVIVDAEKTLDILETLQDEKRTIFVHIEECDMVHKDRAKFERGLDNIIKENNNIHVVYSTSRIDHKYLNDWMEKYINLKVVFKTATKEDSEFLLGKDLAYNFMEQGERILAFHDMQIECLPFSKEELKKLQDFKL